MARKEDKNLIVGLDIGTSKVVVIVGEVSLDGAIEVVGIGMHPSRGLKKGVVVNIESTVRSIQHAVDEAERMAGCQIHSVYTGISGSHIRGLNSHGVTAIKNREATPEDVFPRVDSIRAAIEAASFTVSTSPTPLKATMSFGIAGRLRPGQTAEEILHNADQALYQAKRAGRNRVCLYVESALDGAGSTPGPRAAAKRESPPETPPPLGRDHYQAAAL